MGLWRVDVAGVSHRFVEADSRSEAEAQVRSAIVESLDIRATTAVRQIAEAYEKAGPLQRKKILANIDGLNDPKSRRDAKAARRRLERMDRQEARETEWLQRTFESAPPLSQAAIEDLVRLQSVQHTEENYDRLRDWTPPIYGE